MAHADLTALSSDLRFPCGSTLVFKVKAKRPCAPSGEARVRVLPGETAARVKANAFAMHRQAVAALGANLHPADFTTVFVRAELGRAFA
jgi:hypothetical protein